MYKQIQAGGNGTLTQRNASRSVSLVFSDAKLAQVLLIGKSDWSQTLAELKQKYGSDDDESNDKAVWSYSDGGGITASVQTGNVVRVSFYSKDAQPDAGPTLAPRIPQMSPEAEGPSAVFAGSEFAAADYLSPAEVQAATLGSGKGVTITAGGESGQALVAGLANVNLVQFASIRIYTTESWIAFRAHRARRQYQPFNSSSLSAAETLRGLTVVALGGAYGSLAGPQCGSVTRIALISGKGGEVVAESVDQESVSSSWSNAFGASATCDKLFARFVASDVQHVSASAERGEFYIGVFSGSNRLFMYKVKEKYLKELGR